MSNHRIVPSVDTIATTDAIIITLDRPTLANGRTIHTLHILSAWGGGDG